MEGCLGRKNPGFEGFEMRQDKVLEVSEFCVFHEEFLSVGDLMANLVIELMCSRFAAVSRHLNI